MATLTHSGSRRLYSWWWDSHISPKNSKWLQENLTDMDAKVKTMIKLIEEDADSFARRAEMYYKKRPELMKMLEEIYRAYRALAERYDYATGELRQAHRTMAEAFPNQVPYDLTDELSPSETSVSGPEDSHGRETSHQFRTFSDLDDLSVGFHGNSKRGQRQVDEDVFSRFSCENQNLEGFGDSSETEPEKESIFLKLSNLETELKNAKEEAAGLDQRARNFEIEVDLLKENLSRMEAERDAHLLRYNQSVESISNLENLLSLSQEEAQALDMRAGKAKTETQYLRLQLSSSEYEKEASLRQYKQCLEKMSVMEAKISAAEENSRGLNEHVERAESEINSLKETINELNKEKEAAFLVKSELSRARNDAKKLNDELLGVLNKLDSAEVKCSTMEDSNRALQLEVNDLMEKIAMKDEELAQRQVEFEKFQIQMHEEQSRFEQVETNLHNLENEISSLKQIKNKLEEEVFHKEDSSNALEREKADLLIELQIARENMQKLLEKNSLLENSLSGANSELEGLRDHSKSLEEVCELLKREKSNLVSERDELVSQLANVELGLRTLEEKFSNLEDKYSSLENENGTTIDQVEELRSSIVAEKEELASYKTLNETRMSGFETKIHVLQQKSGPGKKEFEEELEKAVNAQVEIFILRKFVEDLEMNNCLIFSETQKLDEAARFSNKLIAELERENLEQQVEIEFLVDEIENLKRGIHRLFKAVQINQEYGQKDGIEREKFLLLSILNRVEELKTCLCRSKDEKQQLLIENSVFLTLLGQIGLEGGELQKQRNYLENEFKILKEELGLNEKEKFDLKETEKFLAGKIQAQNLKLENLRRDYLVLQKEKSDLIEEKRFELEKVSDLRDAYHVLEEENKMIIEEDVALEVFSIVFESFRAEKALEMKALKQDLDRLHLANDYLKEKAGEMAETLVMKETEILRLKELVEKLDDELHEVKKHNDLLIHEIVLGNNFLRRKVEGLSETEQELKDSQELNARLCNRIEELKMECKDLTLIREDLEIENLELCIDGHRQNEEINWLLEMNENLKSEVDFLHNEVEECRIGEDNLSSELQASAVREVFLGNELHEITRLCEKIVGECAAKDAEIRSLRESCRILESEMQRLKLGFSATSSRKNAELHSNTNVEVRGSMKVGEESKSNGKMMKRLGNGTQMKDIPLDQVSGLSIHGRSKRESREANDLMLQLWEAVDPKTDHSLISNNAHNLAILPLPTNQIVREEQNRSDSSSEIEREAALGDDRFERSSSIRERSQGGKKRKILQRLASDAQKLTNLRTTVLDLNKRMETKSWSKKESYTEHEKVYKQLKEVEETVLHLVNTNDQLTKNAEQSPSSLAGKTASELEIENVARNSMMEQTRKASEKIGRLHLEIQSIQLVLLKLEEEKKRKWKTRFLKNKTGVVLKEFIYAGRKTSEKEKKNIFWGCQGPPRNVD